MARKGRGNGKPTSGQKNGNAGHPEWPAAKVEMWELARIREYEANPRTHPEAQLELLARSMREDGVTMPILVDEAGVIIAGHGRIRAAIINGFAQYPVVVAKGWSEEQKRAARISDNSYGLMSGWDAELLKSEIGELKLSGYDIPLLGFPETQLRSFGIALGNEGQTDPEETPEPPKNPVSRRGDLWLLGAEVTCPKCKKTTPLERAIAPFVRRK